MSKELEQYQDAVWDFVLEHCDVTERGSYFVKFHTTGRKELERRIRARSKYGYHRYDERHQESHHQKELRASTLQEEHKVRKKMKSEVWKADAEERRRVLANVKRQNEWRMKYGKWYPVLNFMHNLYTTLTRKK